MEYTKVVQTVVETPTYFAIANQLFSEEERADIVAMLAADAECGDLIHRSSRRTGASMKSQFEQMMDGLNDVEAFLAGEREGFKVQVPQEVDVKAIRNRLGMTQARFSNTFGFSLNAIKHWEGGRRTPEAPARSLLTVIDKNPVAVLRALNPGAIAPAVGSSRPTTLHLRIDRKRQTSRGVPRRRAFSAAGGKSTTK
jgi:putative transcriptional regulator